jgi:hypothetical protein
VAQAIEPAEPRVISAFRAALDQRWSSWLTTSPAFSGLLSMHPLMWFADGRNLPEKEESRDESRLSRLDSLRQCAQQWAESCWNERSPTGAGDGNRSETQGVTAR